MSKPKPRSVEDLLKLTGIGNPLKLLSQSICGWCGRLKVLDKKCDWCTKKRKQNFQIYKERQAQGVAGTSRRDELRVEHGLLFETQEMTAGALRTLQIRTMAILLMEIVRCVQLTNESVQIAPHNMQRLHRILRAAKKVTTGWGKVFVPVKTYRYYPSIVRFICGKFGGTGRSVR